MNLLEGLVKLLADYWPLVLGVLLPWVVQWVARSKWTSNVKGWAAFGVAVFVGVFGAYVAGVDLTPATATEYAAAVYASSQIAYRLFKSVGVTSAWLDVVLKM